MINDNSKYNEIIKNRNNCSNQKYAIQNENGEKIERIKFEIWKLCDNA